MLEKTSDYRRVCSDCSYSSRKKLVSDVCNFSSLVDFVKSQKEKLLKESAFYIRNTLVRILSQYLGYYPTYVAYLSIEDYQICINQICSEVK